MPSKQVPRILITAPKSGSGKTLITIALIKALSKRGKKVSAFKCGPDYIDPLFHKKILGVPSRNLDLFFSDEKTVRGIFCGAADGDISVVEGVMGYYDGLSGISGEASTSHMAAALKAPAVLVIDAKGMARSVLAEIAGFVSMDSEKCLKAVILNNTGKSIFEALKPEIEKRFGLEVPGYFPHQKELQIESRYLGLTLPEEIENIQEMAEKAACELEKTVNLEKILALAESAAPLEYEEKDAFWLFEKNAPDAAFPADKRVRIAVARDSAFCFYYEDNFKLLEHYGAELVPFSPVNDKALPENVSGLIFGGGYPEFFAEKLEQNENMRLEIRRRMNQGIPCLAECGGFMYLQDSLRAADGKVYRMAGAVPGQTFYAGKLVRFGYAAFSAKENSSSLLAAGKAVKGHEFHYFDCTENGGDCRAEKPVTGKTWDCIRLSENRCLGFPHLYYASNPEFAENFTLACRNFANRLKGEN